MSTSQEFFSLPPALPGGAVPQHVSDLASRLTGSSRSSLMLPDADSADLAIVAGSGFSLAVTDGVRVRLGEPVAGMVAQTKRPLLVNGEHDFIGGTRGRAGRYRSNAFMSVPVALDDGRCGVINVADPIGRETYETDDLESLQGLAQLVGQDLALSAQRQRMEAAQATIAKLQRELIWVQEAERTRLARELHDEAGHALTLAIFRLDLERVKSETPPEARDALSAAREAMLGCVATLNEMAFQLRPRILEDLGLVAALRTLVGQAQAPGSLRLDLRVMGQERALGKGLELVAFRVVQEALTNIHKHARASRGWVHVSFHRHMLHIVVQDNGRGLGPLADLPMTSSSQGLRGMRERLESYDGTLAIRARSRGGTLLDVRLPLAARD